LTKLAGEVVANATFLARHGYVVLTYTAQGFGESTGCVTLQSRTYDVKDARQLITKVLEKRPEVKKDAKGAIVGMTGGSYGAGIQANVAESDERIRAINPGRTWNHLAYSLDPNNYVAPGDHTGFTHDLNLQGVFKQEWTSLFFASGNGNPVGGVPPSGTPAGTCPEEKVAAGDVAGLACPGFYLAVCTTFARLSATGTAEQSDRDLLLDNSAAAQITKLRVPTLLFQGQSDTLFNVNDATSTYTALQRKGIPVYMVWNSGGHGGYDSLPGECDVYGRGTSNLDSCYLTLRMLGFFNRFLKGNGDPGPGFSWYQDWVPYKGPGTQYGIAGSFPSGKTTTFTLSGTTDLVRTGATTANVTIVNPLGGLPAAYSETSNFTGPASSPRVPLPPTEIPGQHADFTSPAFPTATDVVGIPELKVRLSHVAPTDLVVFAKAYDVAPDGSAELIKHLIAPARIPSSALSQPVRIKLAGFAHRFDVGHRIRLALATTDLTSYNNKVLDAITITSGPGSTLTVNVVDPPLRLTIDDPLPTPRSPRGNGMLPATGLAVIVPILALALLAGALVLYRRTRGAGLEESDGDVGADPSDGDVGADPLDDGGR
jgi:ABC-2 type transport system ATP-binding protein